MNNVWLKPTLVSLAEAANDPVSATYFPSPLNEREDNPRGAKWLIAVGAEHRVWTDKPEQFLVHILKLCTEPPSLEHSIETRILRDDWD